jgi:hypothetical protein
MMNDTEATIRKDFAKPSKNKSQDPIREIVYIQSSIGAKRPHEYARTSRPPPTCRLPAYRRVIDAGPNAYILQHYP